MQCPARQRDPGDQLLQLHHSVDAVAPQQADGAVHLALLQVTRRPVTNV